MYQIIDDAKLNVQTYSLSGTIDGVAFSGEDVYRKSITVSNEACGTTFDLGYVHIGVLNATFFDSVGVTRNDWEGIEITLNVTIGEFTIPVGVWHVIEASHEGGLHKIKAYDDMEKLEVECPVMVGTSAAPYDWLLMIASACHVTLGNTLEEIEALPNGRLPLPLSEMGDIETYRDLLYWLAKSVCSFATIDRYGHLVLRTFHNEVDDSFPASVRYSKSTYGDEIQRYTGIYINDNKAGIAKYYSVVPDDGRTLSIGGNPFFQTSEAQRAVYAGNILSGLANIEYNNCKVKIPFGIHYDLGDVLLFPDGFGSATNKFCIMGYTWNYGKDYEMRGIPVNKKSKSSTDKDIQGLLDRVSKEEVSSYETKNMAPIVILDNETKEIIKVRMAANKSTRAEVHIEVDLTTQANTPSLDYPIEDNIIHLEDIWQGVNDTAVIGEVSYLINSVEADLHPTETWIDGDHVLHLMYIVPVASGEITTFEAFMKASGGKITIPRGNVWLYAQGVGLVGDDKFNGILDLEDEVASWNLIEIGFIGANDSVSLSTIGPRNITAVDSAAAWQLLEIGFASVGDRVSITTHLYSFTRITEDEDIRITEDGSVRITEGD